MMAFLQTHFPQMHCVKQKVREMLQFNHFPAYFTAQKLDQFNSLAKRADPPGPGASISLLCNNCHDHGRVQWSHPKFKPCSTSHCMNSTRSVTPEVQWPPKNLIEYADLNFSRKNRAASFHFCFGGTRGGGTSNSLLEANKQKHISFLPKIKKHWRSEGEKSHCKILQFSSQDDTGQLEISLKHN